MYGRGGRGRALVPGVGGGDRRPGLRPARAARRGTDREEPGRALRRRPHPGAAVRARARRAGARLRRARGEGDGRQVLERPHHPPLLASADAAPGPGARRRRAPPLMFGVLLTTRSTIFIFVPADGPLAAAA